MDDRPTGYSSDETDDDENWVPSIADDSPPFIRFLKDVYIGSEYDSKSKKQARYVIRNITGISVAIGVIFTLIWYAFPDRFISYRGTLDSTSKINGASRITYEASDLLKNG